jgi:hypothetical protein
VPDASVGAAIADSYRSLDPHGCLVATVGGRVVGSAFLHPRGSTAGAGPVTVDPGAQGAGVGHALVTEVCRLADRAGVRSLRLIQDAFNETAFALYARAGFVAREPLVRASFHSRPALPRLLRTRRAGSGDLPALVALEERLLGIRRGCDYEMLLRIGDVVVLEDEKTARIEGSLARVARGGVAVLGPVIAASLEAIIGLLASATVDLPTRTDTRLLVPTRHADLLGELFAAGLEVHSLCTYMVRGEYTGFEGYYVPTLFPESG